MRRAYFLLALSVLPSPARAQSAQLEQSDAGPRIVATVTRAARLAPDRATVYAAVEANAEAAADAAQRAERKAQAVAEAARQAGVATENVAVVPYGVSPALTVGGYPGSTQQPPFVGRYAVRVSGVRLDQIESLSAALVTAGANGAGASNFEATTADSVRRTLAAQAVTEAEREAQALAAAVGGRLGPVVEATSSAGSTATGFGNPVGFGTPYNVQALAQSPDVMINTTVTVRYRFVPR